LTRDAVEAHLEGLTSGAYLFDAYTAVASGGSSGTRGVFVYDWNGWLGVLLSFTRRRAWMRLADAALGLEAMGVMVGGAKASHISHAIGATLRSSGGDVPISAALPLGEIVSQLNELQPLTLLGYSSVIVALAREVQRGHLRIAPRIVVTIAEPLLPEMRAAIEAAWARPVMNAYGASEGINASSCGQGPGLHLNEDLCVFEPVDARGRPVGPGERAAKLYVTPLFNYAQPLIRYELTDEVTLLNGGPCACGSAMRRIDDIGGRSDDVFTYQGGMVVHPIIFRSPLGRERHIVEYQVRQTERGADVELRTDGPMDADTLRLALVEGLTSAGVSNPQVNVGIRGAEFERQATGKFKRFFPLG
jgi:phenylacetate-coenzyme A ligase PaaK-like adenylate-forming protein